MKKFLLTHGDKKYTPLLNMVRPWNQRYADQHEFIYIEDSVTTPGLPDFYWEKYRLIQQVMRDAQNGDFIAFLDCDALIVKILLDLYLELQKLGFGSYDLACAKYPDNNGFAGWNTGTLFINVNDRSRKFFDEMIAHGPVPKDEWPADYNASVGWEERRLAIDALRSIGSTERRLAMDAVRGVATDENAFRNEAFNEDPIRILSLDSAWNYGHAVRPLGPQALQNAIILHPAEKPLEDKLWLIRHNMELVAKGQTLFDPMTIVPKSTVTYPPMNHDECMGC